MHRILLIIFCLFPYIGFGFFDTDTQPWSILLAAWVILQLLFKNKLRIPKHYFYFIAPFTIALYYFFFGAGFSSGDVVYGLTSLSYYLSTPLIALAVFNKGLPKNTGKIFFNIFLIWFFFGVIQIFYPSVNELLLNSSVRTSTERGLTSLAPEPVWYGRSVLLFLLISFTLYKYELISKKKTLIIFCLSVFQIIIFTYSGTISFYLGAVMLTFFLLSNLKIYKKFLGLSAFFSAGFLIVILGLNYYPEKRLFHLISEAKENPAELTKYGGYSMRVLNAPLAFRVGLIDSQGTGVGLVLDRASEYNFSFLGQKVEKEDTGRLNGGYVMFIYQIGVFGFLWIVGIYRSTMYGNVLNKRDKLFIFLSLMIILFFESSLSNPISAYLLGILMLDRSQATKNCESQLIHLP